MSLLATRSISRLLRVYPTLRSVVLLSSEHRQNDGETLAKTKKKKSPEVRINLVENTSLTVVSMESAHKLANRRNMKLTMIENPEHWMTAGNRKAFELLAPSKKVTPKKDTDMKAQGFRGLKQAVFSDTIQDHDISFKIKQLSKWLLNGYVIEIAVDVSDKCKELVSKIEEEIKDIAKLPGIVKRDSKTLFRIQYEPVNKPDKAKNKEQA